VTFRLSDNLTHRYIKGYKTRTVYLGIVTKSKRYSVWTDALVENIEDLIRYDLRFDGFEVSVKRISEVGLWGRDEFLWRLRIRIA
jgi:hypothetical protein